MRETETFQFRTRFKNTFVNFKTWDLQVKFESQRIMHYHLIWFFKKNQSFFQPNCMDIPHKMSSYSFLQRFKKVVLFTTKFYLTIRKSFENIKQSDLNRLSNIKREATWQESQSDKTYKFLLLQRIFKSFLCDLILMHRHIIDF